MFYFIVALYYLIFFNVYSCDIDRNINNDNKYQEWITENRWLSDFSTLSDNDKYKTYQYVQKYAQNYYEISNIGNLAYFINQEFASLSETEDIKFAKYFFNSIIKLKKLDNKSGI